MNNQISEPTQTQLRKYDDLKKMIKGFGSVAVAFSGGVDSTFLLYTAKEALGDQVIAVTAQSCSFPKRELDEAKSGVLPNRKKTQKSQKDLIWMTTGTIVPDCRLLQNWVFKALYAASVLRKMISGHYPNILASRPWTNNLLPVFPPDSYMGRQYPEKCSEWLIRPNNCYWTLDFIRCVYAFMEPLRELNSCRKSFQSSLRKIFEIRLLPLSGCLDLPMSQWI